MNIRLSKFVGRDQLPSDKAAFDRISRAFAPGNTQGPAADNKVLLQRRTRTVSPPLRKVA
jgi:hypothetical protein